MRHYNLRLVTEDFTYSDNSWISGIVDLYDTANSDSDVSTPSYRNYSETNSGFGLHLAGDTTWVGLETATPNDATPVYTSSGYLVDNRTRFVDTSGRIDIVDWRFSLSNLPGIDAVDLKIKVYTADSPDAAFPDEWTYTVDVREMQPISVINSNRYARFELIGSSAQDISTAGVELIVGVRIDRPVMAPLYRSTRSMLDRFPEWMEIREEDNRPDSFGFATPVSVGGQVLNAVAGEWLDDLYFDMEYTRLQQYINTADEDQPYRVYRSDQIPDRVWHVVGDGVWLAQAANFDEFFTQSDDTDIYFLSREDNVMYTRKLYTDLQINNQTYHQSYYRIWNWFDDIGAYVDLPRLASEDNDTYRKRILDVYQNKPGVGLENFKLALRRELDIWQAYGATPDSDYLGATPTVLEMGDLARDSQYTNPDGLPTERYKSLVQELAEKQAATWGFFRYGEARWDTGGLRGEGYDTLPNVYDATPLTGTNVQSGVGDGNDLYLYRPDDSTGARAFDVTAKVRGKARLSTRNEYLPVRLKAKFYATADKEVYTNPTVTEWFTIKLTGTGATPTGPYYHPFQLSMVSNWDAATPSQNEYSYSWADETGYTFPEDTWYNGTDSFGGEEGAATPFYIDATLATVEVFQGRYNPATQTIVDQSSVDGYTVWFSDDYATVLEHGDTSIVGSVSPILGISKLRSSAIETVTYEEVEFDVVMNGVEPDMTTQSFSMPVPPVLWDEVLAASPNKKYYIEILTQDASGNPAGMFQKVGSGDTVDAESVSYLPDTAIYVNGSNSWSSGVQSFTASGVSGFTFTTGTSGSPVYPAVEDVWTYFESSYTGTISGVVDENGPWAYGVPPAEGNDNYVLTTVDFTRADFGIPETTDYVITWLGVESGDDRVIVWIDSNSVESAVGDGSSLVYPDNAIAENYTGSVYEFDPVRIKARLRPGADKQWNPKLHSGWFYDRDEENYVYALPGKDSITGQEHILADLSTQGAPIIVKTNEATPQEYRQIIFWDEDSSSATLQNTETVIGNGTEYLYIAFEDVYGVSVTDLNTGTDVTLGTASLSNVVRISTASSYDHEYEVTYTLRNSYYADNEYITTDGLQQTKLYFDATPSTPLIAFYETSEYNPATPIDLPLNPFYTTFTDGYVFYSSQEYDLDTVELRLSPAVLIDDGLDYSILSIRSFDVNGNPKPNQSFTLSTTYGTLDKSSVTTDRDGFAVAMLTADSGSGAKHGTVTATHPSLTRELDFTVTSVGDRQHRILGMSNPQQIPADGRSVTYVYGRVETDQLQPVPYAAVYWRKGRYLKDLFEVSYSDSSATPGQLGVAGRVLADDEGYYSIGPFVSATPFDPGYWFVATESESASPNLYATPNYFGSTPDFDLAGDITMWLEHISSSYGVEELSGLPVQYVQYIDKPDNSYYYIDQGFAATPSSYDDATPYYDATPATLNWQPPSWWQYSGNDVYIIGYSPNRPQGENRFPSEYLRDV